MGKYGIMKRIPFPHSLFQFSAIQNNSSHAILELFLKTNRIN